MGSVSDLRDETDHALVVDMLALGRSLLETDAREGTQTHFGFHVPPFNSVDHLHLHCLALPFSPSWKSLKYTETLLGSWLPVEKCLRVRSPVDVRPHRIVGWLSLKRCAAVGLQRLRRQKDAAGETGESTGSRRGCS